MILYSFFIQGVAFVTPFFLILYNILNQIVMYSKRSNPVVFASIGEKVVINPNLASTPAQMNIMRLEGKPIGNSVDESSYFDGSEDAGFIIPLANQRGVDIAEAWEASVSAHGTINKLNKLANQQNVQSTERSV